MFDNLISGFVEFTKIIIFYLIRDPYPSQNKKNRHEVTSKLFDN